jgi:hypothetical protein
VLKLLSFESERKMCKDPWLKPADGKVGGAIRFLRPLAPPGWGTHYLCLWLIPAAKKTTPHHGEGSPLLRTARKPMRTRNQNSGHERTETLPCIKRSPTNGSANKSERRAEFRKAQTYRWRW